MNKFEEILNEEREKEYFKELTLFVNREYKSKKIFPPRDEIFTSLRLTPYDDVKVVIIGQDPYHGEGEAHGLSFSVKPGIKVPPSLQNIYKELNDEYGCYIPDNGYLVKWASQGVLMLNSVLTVQKDKPGSHRNKGWEIFTNRIIEKLNEREQPIVFVLWGNYAKEKEALITNKQHLILKSAHPSPFSARNGFFGNNHFIKINEFLKEKYNQEIDWQIENIENGENENENK